MSSGRPGGRIEDIIAGFGSVVGLLGGDVLADGRNDRLTDGEGTIAVLPFERLVGPMMGDSIGGDALDLGDELGDGKGGRQFDQEMHVIGHTVECYSLSVLFPAFGGDGAIHQFPNGNNESRRALIGSHTQWTNRRVIEAGIHHPLSC